jgi:hypothetical protein
MRRILSVAAVACALLTAGTADARLGDSARGRGLDVSLGRFSFTAEGFGIGAEASGFWRHTFSQAQGHATLAGEVTCLVVFPPSGASLSGFITESDLPNVPPGSGFQVSAVDVADPGDGADTYGFITTPTYSPGECATPAAAMAPIARGNIDVVASTFPA